jgi:hypothetical protein
VQQQGPAPAPAFEPASLTIDGLASAWQFPFYLLGELLHWLRITPDPEPVFAVGRRRAKDLATPSYIVYEHYARQYLGAEPDNQVVAAACVTGLNAIGIVPDVIEAVKLARRRAAQTSPHPPGMDARRDRSPMDRPGQGGPGPA